MSISTIRQQWTVIVYMHTNTITGKSYIGTTTRTMDRRFSEHIYAAKTNIRKYSKFHRAIRKYGDQCWNSVILFCCDSPTAGFAAEKQLIEEYDTFRHGYNTTMGGDSGPIMTGEDNPMWGRTHTDEVKQHIGQLAKERYTGKSYDERHGGEKAAQLRQKRSDDMKRIRQDRSGVGSANPNHKTDVFAFTHISGATPLPAITAVSPSAERLLFTT